MNDIAIAVIGLVMCTAIVTAAALLAWREWMAIKAEELAMRHAGLTGAALAGPDHIADSAAHTQAGADTALAQIEISDLRQRIRKLEAIANGIDI